MKKIDIEIGHVYEAKVSGHLQPVRILAAHHAGGWIGRNEHTGREVRIKSNARLRFQIDWSRVDRIRHLREQGLSFDAARGEIDKREQDAHDMAADVSATEATHAE